VAVRSLLSFYSIEFIIFIVSVIYSIELYSTALEHKATAFVQAFIQNSADVKLQSRIFPDWLSQDNSLSIALQNTTSTLTITKLLAGLRS